LSFHSIFRKAAAVTLSQVIIAFSGLAMVYIFTRLISPEEYGAMTYGVLVVTIFSQLLFGPIGAAVTRFRPRAKQTKYDEDFVSAVNLIRVVIVVGIVVLSSILIPLLYFFENLSEGNFNIIFAGLIFAFATGLFTIDNAQLLGEDRQVLLSYHRVVEVFLRLTFGIIFGYIFVTGTSVVLGFACGTGLMLLVKRPKRLENLARQSYWLHKIYRYSKPFALWGGFTALYLVSDRFLLGYFGGAELVGKYAPIYQLTYVPIIMIFVVVSQLITPRIYAQAKSGKLGSNFNYIQNKVVMLSVASILVTLIISSIYYIGQKYISEIFLGNSYKEYSYVMPYLVLSAGIFSSGQICSLAIQAKDRVDGLISVKIVTAVVGIFMNYFGAKYYGLVGIVMSSIAFGIFYYSWILIIVFREKGE